MKNAVSNVWPVPGLLKTPNTLRLWFNGIDYTADAHKKHHLLAKKKKKILITFLTQNSVHQIELEKSHLYKYPTRFSMYPSKHAAFLHPASVRKLRAVSNAPFSPCALEDAF